MWCVCVCWQFRSLKICFTNRWRKLLSRKLDTIGFCLCSDLERYKYTPGEHKIADAIGSPNYFFLLPFIELCVLSNDFSLVEIRDGLPEGKGLFCKMDVPHCTFICNYGGKLMTNREGKEYMAGDNDFCYFYEFNFDKNGRNTKLYYNHTKETFSFGKFINHSRNHYNVLPKVFFRADGQPEIMFISLKKISKGEEILFDYGRHYEGVNSCVSSCKKCKFLFKK